LEFSGLLVLINSMTINLEMGSTFLILHEVFYLLYISKKSFYFHLVELRLFVLTLDDIASDLMI